MSVWAELAERSSIGSYVPVLRQDLEWARLKTRHGKPNVMLADDPHSAAPDKIKDIAIVRTVVGGATTYAA